MVSAGFFLYIIVVLLLHGIEPYHLHIFLLSKVSQTFTKLQKYLVRLKYIGTLYWITEPDTSSEEQLNRKVGDVGMCYNIACIHFK